IGQNVPMLIGKPTTGASHAGLHFVENQKQTMLIRQLSQSLEVSRGRQMDAAFSLNRFNEQSTCLDVDELGSCFEIAIGSIFEPRQERVKTLMIFWLASGTQGAKSAAVKAVDGANDLVTAIGFAVQSSQLDRRFDRFGAAV